MKTDMTMKELASFLPKAMPEGIVVGVGDKILVRFMRRDFTLYPATIVDLFNPVSGEKLSSTTLMRASSSEVCLRVVVEGEEKTERPLWPFQDRIYPYAWVNDWAGMEVVKPPALSTKAQAPTSRRLQKLLGPES